MHTSTTENTRKPLNTNLKETYEIGKQLYWEGVHAYQTVHKAIRYLGFYLYMGDEDRGIPSMKSDDTGRAKLIFDLITKKLFWSVDKAKELWTDIYNACIWRKGKVQETIVPELEVKPKPSSNSTNSFNRNNSSTNTIYVEPDATSQEQRTASKEEIRAIFKSVLGDKINFENPSGMMGTMLRSIRI